MHDFSSMRTVDFFIYITFIEISLIVEKLSVFQNFEDMNYELLICKSSKNWVVLEEFITSRCSDGMFSWIWTSLTIKDGYICNGWHFEDPSRYTIETFFASFELHDTAC